MLLLTHMESPTGFSGWHTRVPFTHTHTQIHRESVTHTHCVGCVCIISILIYPVDVIVGDNMVSSAEELERERQKDRESERERERERKKERERWREGDLSSW